MQGENFVQTELTARANNPTLKREVNIYMAETTDTVSSTKTASKAAAAKTSRNSTPPRGKVAWVKEGIQPRTAPKFVDSIGPQGALREQNARDARATLAKEWKSVLTEEEYQNPDTRAAIAAAIKLGYGPKEKTSKGRIEQSASQVVENALLDRVDSTRIVRFKELLSKETLTKDEQEELLTAHKLRLEKAQELLLKPDEEFTLAQKLAILKAHYVGYGEPGKDKSRGAGLYNYSQEQLRQKAEILGKEVDGKELFDLEQRRVLIEAGITAPVPPLTDAILLGMWQAIDGQIAQGLLDYAGARHYEDKIRDYMEQNQANLVIRADGLRSIVELSRIKKTLAGDRSKEEDEQKFIQKYKEEAGQAGSPLHTMKDNIRTKRQEIWQIEDAVRSQGGNPTTAQQNDLTRLESELKGHERELYKRLTDTGPGMGGFDLENFSLQTGRIDSELVLILADSDRALNHLVSKIIDVPRLIETSNYQVGFQPGIALDIILGVLKDKSDSRDIYERKIGRAQFTDQTKLKETQRIIHEVARIIAEGQEGTQAARAVRAEHLELLQRMPGVGMGRQIYDNLLLLAVSQNGYLSSEASNEILSAATGEITGRNLAHQPRSLYSLLEAQIKLERDNPDSPYYEMEGWEIRRAYDAAASFHSITERISEVAAYGSFPEEQTDRAVPREFSVRVLNPIVWSLERFTVFGKEKVEAFMKLYRKSFAASKKAEGFTKKLNITKLFGEQKVENIEQNGALGLHGGFDSTWRERDVFFSKMKIPERDFTWHDNSGNHNVRINTLDDIFRIYETEFHGSIKEKAAFLREAFFDNGQFRPEFRVCLGMLIRRLNPNAHDTVKHIGIKDVRVDTDRGLGRLNLRDTSVWDVKEQIRREIWTRVAEDDPLTMMSFLHGLTYVDANGKVIKKINIFGKDGVIGTNPDPRISPFRGVIWEELQSKLLRLSVLRTNSYINGQAMSLDQVITANNTDPSIALTTEERAFLGWIRTEGKNAAGELANVKFSIAPFMTDIPFQISDYAMAGQASFVRRMGSDFDGFKAGHKMLNEEVFAEAFGGEAKHLVDKIGQIVKTLSGPVKEEGAQDKMYPVIEGILGLRVAGSDDRRLWGNEAMVQLRSSVLGKMILGALHKSNSIAQQYHGLKAESLDVDHVLDLGQDLVKNGAVSVDTFNKRYKKKFAGLLAWKLWMYFFSNLFIVGASVTGLDLTLKKGFGENETLKS